MNMEYQELVRRAKHVHDWMLPAMEDELTQMVQSFTDNIQGISAEMETIIMNFESREDQQQARIKELEADREKLIAAIQAEYEYWKNADSNSFVAEVSAMGACSNLLAVALGAMEPRQLTVDVNSSSGYIQS